MFYGGLCPQLISLLLHHHFLGMPHRTNLAFFNNIKWGGAGSNQCKKMQDWHKTDLKLTQKSLDVWISLDFHLGPPKTNFGIKKQ
jgi:hypothetical protein